jgi:hypothetical protein
MKNIRKKHICGIIILLVLTVSLLSKNTETLIDERPVLPRFVSVTFHSQFYPHYISWERVLDFKERFTQYDLKMHSATSMDSWLAGFIFNLDLIHPLLILDKIVADPYVWQAHLSPGWYCEEIEIWLREGYCKEELVNTYSQYELSFIKTINELNNSHLFHFNSDLICELYLLGKLNYDARVRLAIFNEVHDLSTANLVIRLQGWVTGEYFTEFLNDYNLVEYSILNKETNTKYFRVDDESLDLVYLANDKRVVYWFLNVFDFDFQLPVSITDQIIKVSNSRHFAYPNPVTGNEVRFMFSSIGESISISPEINIFNIRGQLIKRLTDFGSASMNRSVSWDLRDRNNQNIPSGIYFYQIKTDRSIYTGRFLIIRTEK